MAVHVDIKKYADMIDKRRIHLLKVEIDTELIIYKPGRN